MFPWQQAAQQQIRRLSFGAAADADDIIHVDESPIDADIIHVDESPIEADIIHADASPIGADIIHAEESPTDVAIKLFKAICPPFQQYPNSKTWFT